MVFALAGCGQKKQARAHVPPPPGIEASAPPPATPSNTEAKPKPQPPPLPPDARPLFVETGYASWYGAPYNNRRGANGQIYDMNAYTAAHRTFPLNSIVRVTNVATGASTLVTITDRGPFVDNRIIDLSVAAAKAVGVWRPGTAKVKLEVLQSPAAIDRGGRWAVQMGGFGDQEAATRIKETLARRYHTAKVLEFSSPVGDWWVRVRVLDDDKQRAEEVARNSPAPRENTFLVRLD